MHHHRKIIICFSVLLGLSVSAFGWSTGIGIIDNNVPKVIKDPTIILKNPVEAFVDFAAKSGCWGCDKIYEKALPADQREIINAVITTGFVTSPLGTVGNVLTLGVLVSAAANQEVEAKEVPVRVSNPVRTPNSWDVTADCIAQRGARIEAYLIGDLPNVSKIKKGDTLRIKAKFCSIYNIEGTSKSITSADIVLQGISEDPTSVEGKEYKTYLTGALVT